MVKVQLEFSRQNWKPFSWLIRAATWSPWSHVDVIMPNDLRLGARGGKGVIITGVVTEASEKAVYEVELTAEQADKFFTALKSQLGKGYDWWGIIGFTLRKDWHKENAWFCSELVAWAFKQAGKPVICEKSSMVTPRDLTISPYFKRVTK